MTHKSIGALHIHTTYSDGTSTIEEVSSAAKKAGLNWVIVTDHNNLTGLKNNQEGWYDGVAVLVGEEISPEKSNHYLAFDIKQKISEEQSPENYVKQVKEQGGFGFIAHPEDKKIKWQNWDIQGFDGIEIWNHLSDWYYNYSDFKAIYSLLAKDKTLKGPSKKVLEWWDRLNNQSENIIPAIGGVDVHAFNYNILGYKFQVFPYEYTFNTIANCIYLEKELSQSFEEAKIQIYTALRQGKNTIINRIWDKKSEQFEFFIKNKEKKAYSGGFIELDSESIITVTAPKKARIRIIYNGEVLQETNSPEITLNNLKKGKYRAEIYLNKHPWIFTNPINVQ